MAKAQSPVSPAVVFVPNLRLDRGMGHLRRCLDAAARVGKDAAVFLAFEALFTSGKPVFQRQIVLDLATAAGVEVWEQWPQLVTTVVVDLQICELSVFWFLRERTRQLIGWDLGGPARERFPFLVDSLPHDTRPFPNLRLPGLLGLSLAESGDLYDRPIKTILAVFGGADPVGLTLRFLKFVETLEEQGNWPYVLRVIRGPLAQFQAPQGVEVVDSPTDLSKLLHEADLTVTSWGLTALESLAEGTPVLLLNPTRYHEALSRKAGLPTLGLRRPRKKAFWKGLKAAPEAARSQAAKLVGLPQDAGRYFLDFHGSDGRCPVCGTAGHRVFARTSHKSYHQCQSCGMEYLSVHQLPRKTYSEAYFFEDYQKQYGKTYLDDFAHIQELGSQRLTFLEAKCGTQPSRRRVLDVGCAYGPFLAAAAQAGYQPFGLDVADDAVKYVTGTLKFPAVVTSFLDFSWKASFEGPLPDVVTLWYVIEHFPDLDAVLKKVNSLLDRGGIFAFSTPNGRGITRNFRPKKFWQESPDDHFSIWNPGNAKSVLRRYGFKVVAIRMTGRHPERFPGLKGDAGFLYSMVAFLDRLFGWGDTFEVYATKTKEFR